MTILIKQVCPFFNLFILCFVFLSYLNQPACNTLFKANFLKWPYKKDFPVYTLHCKDTSQQNHDHNPHFIYPLLDTLLKKERKDEGAADLDLSFLSQTVALENLPVAFDDQIRLAAS